MAVTNPVSTTGWATYLDFNETWEYLQEDNAPTGGAALRLQRFIDSACSVAQGPGGANRPLCPTQVKERHDGWSGEYVTLAYAPVLELVLCREWQSSGGFLTLPESTPENPIEGVQVEYATGRLMRTFSGYSWPRPFFPGHRNIEVTYIAGFNPVPPEIWEATMDLVAYKWRMSQEAPNWFRGNAQYGGAETSPLYPGVPNRIAEVFAGYRLPTIG